MPEVAGRLDEQVVVLTPTRTEDTEGGHTTEYTAAATVPADIRSLRGEERFAAAASETTVTHTVRLRWRDDVTAATRLQWGTRLLEVVGPPVELGRRRLLECYCAERVA